MSAALKLVDSLITKIDAEDANESPRFVFGYWNIGGFAAPARMMFLYANCAFENVMYSQRNEWYDIKFKMDLDFPNVPYLIDQKTGMRLTESLAIYAYLGRQLNIGAQSDPYQVYNDMVIGVVKDLWSSFARLCYGTYPVGKEEYLNETLVAKLKVMDAWLRKSDKKYFTGDQIAVCDFVAYFVLFCNVKMQKTCLDGYPSLLRFYQEFEKLAFMKRYKELGYYDLPLNGHTAKFR